LGKHVFKWFARVARKRVVKYVYDFLVLGKSIKDFEELAISKIYKFSKPRKLTLSERKTKITDISKDFDYFESHFSEYQDKTRMKGT